MIQSPTIELINMLRIFILITGLSFSSSVGSTTGVVGLLGVDSVIGGVNTDCLSIGCSGEVGVSYLGFDSDLW